MHVARWAIGVAMAMAAHTGWTHEVRPGFLELREVESEHYSVLWKVPLRGAQRLQLSPVLPATCTGAAPVSEYPAAGAIVQRWNVHCPGGLDGGRIEVAGLADTLTDVLVRVEGVDGTAQVERLQPSSPTMTVTGAPAAWRVIWTYLGLGVEHILLGFDHLLFVLALLIIVDGWRRLVATVTAFTVAHSITLAAATLGIVNVPPKPVEAVIALSILFLAVEIVHGRQGRAGIAERWPWLVAFTFGLLHGLGFAGALAEVGLPERSIPLALLFFNLGVEAGQLMFIGAVLSIAWLMRRIGDIAWARVELATTYGIGALAAFWTIERVAGFWG